MKSLPPDIPDSAGPRFFQSYAERRAELGSDIVAAGLMPGAAGASRLDRFLFETKPAVLRRLASLLCERVPAGIDRLASSGAGTVIVATALSLECGIPFVVVGRWPESGGSDTAADRVAGEYHPGERALLVSDVVTAGTEVAAAAARVRAAGMVLDSALAVIDWEQGAADAFGAAGLSLDALFTRSRLAQEAR